MKCYRGISLKVNKQVFQWSPAFPSPEGVPDRSILLVQSPSVIKGLQIRNPQLSALLVSCVSAQVSAKLLHAVVTKTTTPPDRSVVAPGLVPLQHLRSNIYVFLQKGHVAFFKFGIVDAHP